LSTKEREAFLALALLRQCFFILGLCWHELKTDFNRAIVNCSFAGANGYQS